MLTIALVVIVLMFSVFSSLARRTIMGHNLENNTFLTIFSTVSLDIEQFTDQCLLTFTHYRHLNDSTTTDSHINNP